MSNMFGVLIGAGLLVTLLMSVLFASVLGNLILKVLERADKRNKKVS